MFRKEAGKNKNIEMFIDLIFIYFDNWITNISSMMNVEY